MGYVDDDDGWSEDYIESLDYPEAYEDEEEIMPEENETEPTTAADSITVKIQQRQLHDLLERVACGLVDRFEKRLQKTVAERLDKLFEEKIAAMCQAQAETFIADYMTKSRQGTNRHGEPVGEPYSFADMILTQWQGHLTEKVSEDGKTSNYGGITRADWMLRQWAMQPLANATKEAIDGITAKAREVVKRSVSDYIASQLMPQIHVEAMKLPEAKK